MKSGVVKSTVFLNLLSCMDVEIDQNEYADAIKKLGLQYQGVTYVKYEIILRQMQYDNHSEKWIIKNTNQDGDTLSVIAENTRAAKQNK